MFFSLMRVGVGITDLLPKQKVEVLAGILPHAALDPSHLV